MPQHILHNYFLPPIAKAKYKIGSLVKVLFNNDLAYARIESITERAGELAYEVRLWTIEDISDRDNGLSGIETWIWPDMIIKVQ